MRLLFVLLLAISVSACATLNRSECETADWRVIGYEDGAHGRALSYLGKHRKACAEYGIRPIMERYEQGRQAGLAEYCVPQNGFRLGRKGSRLNSHCPAPFAQDFQQAWSNGNQLYQAESAHQATQRQIDALLRQQADAEAQLGAAERELIRQGISKRHRRRLLNEIDHLHHELRGIQYECSELERQLVRDHHRVERLRAKFLY